MRTVLAIVLGLLESVLIVLAPFAFFVHDEDQPMFIAIAVAAVLVGIAGFRYSPPGKGKLIFVGFTMVVPLLIVLLLIGLKDAQF